MNIVKPAKSIKLTEKTITALSYNTNFWKSLELPDLLRNIIGVRKVQKVIDYLESNYSTALIGLRNLDKQILEFLGLNNKDCNALLACIELGCRMNFANDENVEYINSSEDAAKAVSKIAYEEKEHFIVVPLDITNKVLSEPITISVGTATECLASPRESFRQALKRGATKILIAHNHPSGSVTPSQNDIDLTKNFLHNGQMLGIEILDHLVVGKDKFHSIRGNSTLWEEFPQSA